MKKTIQGLLGGALLLTSATPALANPGGGYEGITALYYSIIACILAYGCYDIFFKKE